MVGAADSSMPALDAQLRQELQATLAAAHELGPDYEPQLVDAFIDHVRPLLAAPQPAHSVRVRRRPQQRILRLVAVGVALLMAWWVVGPLSMGASHTGRTYSWSLHTGTSQALPPVPPAPPAPPLPPPPPIP